MPQIGPLELMVVAAVALIVFGPNRLPEIARTIGKTLSELRRQANEIRSEFATSFDENSVDPQESKPAEQASAHGTGTKPERVDELSAHAPPPNETSSG